MWPHALLSELAADDRLSIAELTGRFMDRRYERCRLVVENPVQIGEWEINPDTPGADTGRLTGASHAWPASARPAHRP
jgi:hypothetical protein